MKYYLFWVVLCIGTQSMVAIGNDPVIQKPSRASWTIENIEVLESEITALWNEIIDKLSSNFPTIYRTTDVEQQPRTEENSALISQAVAQVVDNHMFLTALFEAPVALGQLLEDTPSATQDSLLTAKKRVMQNMCKRMFTNCLIEVLLEDVSGKIDWCTCIPEPKRIALAMMVVRDARKNFDLDKELVYTSFASGELLQDYIVICELLEAYENISMNAIDMGYPDVHVLKRDKDSAIGDGLTKAKKVHALYVQDKKDLADIIDAFKTKIAQYMSRKEGNKGYQFNLNIYEGGYQYAARIMPVDRVVTIDGKSVTKKFFGNEDEKSHILMLVDPSMGFFAMPSCPSLGNVISIWMDEEVKNPTFVIFMPHHHPIQIYEENTLEPSEGTTISAASMQLWQNKKRAMRAYLTQLMRELGDQRRGLLVEKLLHAPLAHGPISDYVLTRLGFDRIMQERNALYAKIEAGESYIMYEEIMQDLIPVQLAGQRVLLGVGTDAHINFQDLVFDTLRDNGLVYGLYNTPEADSVTRVQRINVSDYKKADVIESNGGKYLLLKDGSTYQRISIP